MDFQLSEDQVALQEGIRSFCAARVSRDQLRELDASGKLHERAFEPKDLEQLRAELAALPDDAPYAEWGRWILADRATRPIAPGFR